MEAVPWQCPDPQCGGLLDRQHGKRVYLDPQTGKDMNHPLLAELPIIFLCGIPGYLIWAGTGALVEALSPGTINVSLPLKFLAGVGLATGFVVNGAALSIFQRRRKVALARVEYYASYRCLRCGKWWMLKDNDQPETRSGEQISEEEKDEPA